MAHCLSGRIDQDGSVYGGSRRIAGSRDRMMQAVPDEKMQARQRRHGAWYVHNAVFSLHALYQWSANEAYRLSGCKGKSLLMDEIFIDRIIGCILPPDSMNQRLQETRWTEKGESGCI